MCVRNIFTYNACNFTDNSMNGAKAYMYAIGNRKLLVLRCSTVLPTNNALPQFKLTPALYMHKA